MKKLILGICMASFMAAFSQKQAEVNLELHDGNVIKGTATFNDIDLTTSYGKLLIPITKVGNIKIGYGRDKSSSEKVNSYIKLLNTSNNEEVRKGAYTDLVKMGVKALTALEDHFNSSSTTAEIDYTGDYTVDNALEEIKTNNNITESSSADDIVTIDNTYNMGGTYNFTKLDVKTEYGSLSIPKEKIRSIDIFVSSGSGNGEMFFKLMANKNISGNQNGGWYKTGITLKAGQKFSMSATGEVTLASLSNAVYKPDGSTKASGATDYSGGDYDGSSTYATYGMLVYKIGETSYDNLKAGSKFSGTAKTSGILYISIYETVFNANNKGSYNVKVMVNK